MVEILRNQQRKYVPDEVSANKAARNADLFSGITNTGMKVAQVGAQIAEIKQNNKAQQQKFENQVASANAKTVKDFQDANDAIVAADNAGKMESDLLRYNEQIKLSNPDYVGTREYEEDLRNKANEFNQKYGAGMGEKGTMDYTKSANDKVNQIVESNIRWSFAEKNKKAEESAKNLADNYALDSKYFGQNQDLAGFDQNRSNNRQKLDEYIQKVSPAYKNAALYEADRKAVTSFLSGVAENNPELAKAYLDNDENLKRIVGSDMLGNVGEIYNSAKQRQIDSQRTLLQEQLDSAPDKQTRKQIQKQIEKLDNESESLGKDTEKTESESLAAIRKEIAPDINNAIKRGEAQKVLRDKQMETANQVGTFNKFIMTPDYETIKKNPAEKKELRNAMENYYHSTADIPTNIVPDVDTAIPAIVNNCKELVKMNIEPDGDMSPVLTKAYTCLTDLNKKGLTNNEMQGMREYIQKMATEPYFKEGTERIISGAMTGNWYPADTQDIMRKQSKQAQYNAFFGAMNILSQGKDNPDEAIKQASEYMYNARQATFAKLASDRYGIDVDKMQKEVAKGKDAFIDLGNGNMSYFRGFDANGNVIVEPTMTKIKDDRF